VLFRSHAPGQYVGHGMPPHHSQPPTQRGPPAGPYGVMHGHGQYPPPPHLGMQQMPPGMPPPPQAVQHRSSSNGSTVGATGYHPPHTSMHHPQHQQMGDPMTSANSHPNGNRSLSANAANNTHGQQGYLPSTSVPTMNGGWQSDKDTEHRRLMIQHM